MAHRLDVLEIVLSKMLRDAGISLKQLRPRCELLARIMAAKQFPVQGVPAPDLEKHLVVMREVVDLSDEKTTEGPSQTVIDLTGELTIDLTTDDPAQSVAHNLEGLAACLTDKQFRDLVIELAHDPATADLTKYRLWAASLGWMAPNSWGLAVAPQMITRNAFSGSVSGSPSRHQRRQPRSVTATPRKRPSQVSTAVKSGRVHKATPVRPAIAKPRSRNGNHLATAGGMQNPAENNKPDIMEEIWDHAMAGASKK
ncbi:hypothetical protein QBC40DRAFT_352683 [Triangularia verruculosa]|uniref:Uncharacterized protein n=1 Tax=Triangularia verruculosa TaxID=2587418 RepID=A0AAN6X927_9PEZI|nr:hypothetical protein QBC40DRAFT_352683 [Triangularia verruculosa]